MSSSTTQPKIASAVEIVDAFQKELQKKIRNKQKKIETINQLEQKIKSKEIVANEEQLSKLASRTQSEAEIAEVNTYLDLYMKSQNEHKESAKKIAKQHARELAAAKKSVVTTVANMITMNLM